MKLMITKEELRSSNELLTDFQGSERSDFCREERGTTSIKETCAPQSIKETCASPLSIPRTQASLFAQRDGGYFAVAVFKMVTKMLRHYD